MKSAWVLAVVGVEPECDGDAGNVRTRSPPTQLSDGPISMFGTEQTDKDAQKNERQGSERRQHGEHVSTHGAVPSCETTCLVSHDKFQ